MPRRSRPVARRGALDRRGDDLTTPHPQEQLRAEADAIIPPRGTRRPGPRTPARAAAAIRAKSTGAGRAGCGRAAERRGSAGRSRPSRSGRSPPRPRPGSRVRAISLASAGRERPARSAHPGGSAVAASSVARQPASGRGVGGLPTRQTRATRTTSRRPAASAAPSRRSRSSCAPGRSRGSQPAPADAVEAVRRRPSGSSSSRPNASAASRGSCHAQRPPDDDDAAAEPRRPRGRRDGRRRPARRAPPPARRPRPAAPGTAVPGPGPAASRRGRTQASPASAATIRSALAPRAEQLGELGEPFGTRRLRAAAPGRPSRRPGRGRGPPPTTVGATAR